MPYATGGGDLRSRVTFAMPDSVSDEYGNVTTGFQDMFTVAAQITPRLGGETVEAARLAGRQLVVMRVRNTADTRTIRTDWRATDVRSRAEYNIRAVADPLMGETQHGQWIDMLADSTGYAASVATGGKILLESGDSILLEDGSGTLLLG